MVGLIPLVTVQGNGYGSGGLGCIALTLPLIMSRYAPFNISTGKMAELVQGVRLRSTLIPSFTAS